MSTPINFIAPAGRGNLRLAKEISADGVRPYPRIKKLNSETHYVESGNDGLTELFGLLQTRAKAGAALLKGPLNEPIIKESRAGKTNSNAPTSLLVLDVDGWRPQTPLVAPITQDSLKIVAESIIGLLPEPLSSTSYIANASSSTGIKENGELGLHFFFLLERAISPQRLELYLRSLNFANKAITEQVGLQASRMSLKWAIDPVVARNAQIVYIANPTFRNTQDPFPTPEDRWALVKKQHGSCDLTQAIVDVDEAHVSGQTEKTLNSLRRAAGLGKFRPKTRVMNGFEGRMAVVTNPDPMVMEMSYHNDNFVYWNVNGGDSNAYYNPIGNPEIIYNFKGEPPFELKKASESTYNWYLEHFKVQIRSVNEARPLVFRDRTQDQHYMVEYVPAHDTVLCIDKIAPPNIGPRLAEFGVSTPEPIPTWDLVFDPQSTTEIMWDDNKVNLFQATEYLKSPPALLPSYSNVKIGGATEAMAALCPTIHKVIFHICGSSLEDFEYFINWLAWCVQNRDKAHTAWVFSGTPGTGKGVFYERILRPIMGEKYAIRKRLDHLEEQFNAYQETALFLVWDEFRLNDSRQSGKLLNKIKDDIVADRVNVRAMRTDVAEKRSYTNYLFFSNHNDALPIEDGDRRFNIAPPQLVKLERQYPTIRKEIQSNIEGELGSFAGFLCAYATDEDLVRTVRENEAKQQMKETAMGFGKRFCHAVKTGQLGYFLDLIDYKSTSSTSRAIQAATAEKYARAWAADAAAGRPSTVTADALLTCYEVLNDRDMPRTQFTTFLKRNDLVLKRRRVNGDRAMALEVEWSLEDEADREFAEEIAGQIDRAGTSATHH